MPLDLTVKLAMLTFLEYLTIEDNNLAASIPRPGIKLYFSILTTPSISASFLPNSMQAVSLPWNISIFDLIDIQNHTWVTSLRVEKSFCVTAWSVPWLRETTAWRTFLFSTQGIATSLWEKFSSAVSVKIQDRRVSSDQRWWRWVSDVLSSIDV